MAKKILSTLYHLDEITLRRSLSTNLINNKIIHYYLSTLSTWPTLAHNYIATQPQANLILIGS